MDYDVMFDAWRMRGRQATEESRLLRAEAERLQTAARMLLQALAARQIGARGGWGAGHATATDSRRRSISPGQTPSAGGHGASAVSAVSARVDTGCAPARTTAPD